MQNILIIKTGAAGDVVRTTSLLNVLTGNVYWITDKRNMPLLPERDGLKGLTMEEARDQIKHIVFDIVISLEEDPDCARTAGGIRTKQLTGLYFDGNRITYTDDSSHWFDMSRI